MFIMAKIKFTPGSVPLLNEHAGYTFQPNNYGQSMFPASKSARKRYKRQSKRQHNNQRAVTNWRNMSAETKTLWNSFAALYPQPSKRNPDVFLTGYQCFIKRNSYCFLNHGILSDFMLEPELTLLDSPTVTFSITHSTYAVDCTELYIDNFGILPKVGDYLLLHAIMYSEYSGQFFEPITLTLQVLDIYLDGLFISVQVPDTFEDITISLYLSKPVNAGVSYAGTKIRYMGCFTVKKFIELQDVFNTYINRAGDIVIVNEAGDGLTTIEIQEIFNDMIARTAGVIVYDENVEWSHTDNITTIDYESILNPFTQSLSALISELTTDSIITFANVANLLVADYGALLLYINLSAAYSATQSVKVRFLKSSVAVSDYQVLTIDTGILETFQAVKVLFSAFTFTDTEFDEIEFLFTDSAGANLFPEFYFDYVTLLYGEETPDERFFDKYAVDFEYDETEEQFVIKRNGNLPELRADAPSSAGTNAFNPIAVSGEDDVEADSTEEELTLIAGTNVEILTDNSSKEITFNVSSFDGNIRGQSQNNYAPASYWYIQVPYPTATSVYCFRKFVLGGYYNGSSFVIEGYVLRKDSSNNIDVVIVIDTAGLGITWTAYSTYVRIYGNDPASGNRFRQYKHYYYSASGQ